MIVYARQYTHLYDHLESKVIGEVSNIPLATSSDLNNVTGTHSFAYDGETGGTGTFDVGEEIRTSDDTKVGILTSITDNGTTGTLEYILMSSTQFANNDTFTGSSLVPQLM